MGRRGGVKSPRTGRELHTDSEQKQEDVSFFWGGKGAGEKMITRLKEYGMDDVTVHIGSRLSYPMSRSYPGIRWTFQETRRTVCVRAMILNPHPDKRTGPHIRDEEFIRGNVPMTKAEVTVCQSGRRWSLRRMRSCTISERNRIRICGSGTFRR